MPVNSTHDQYDKMAGKWKRCRDAAAGQDAIHAAGEQYLPKLGGQDSDEYNAYKKRATYYNATGRTVDGLSGMLFRKEMQVEIPTAIEAYRDDITRDGLTLQNFAEMLAEEVLQTGRAGILVDHPPAVAVLSLAAAQAARMRPYLRLYKAEAVINWKLTDGVLSQVVLEETISEAEDEFSGKARKQWRVLDLSNKTYRQRIFQKNDKDEFIQIGRDIFPIMNGKPIDNLAKCLSGEKFLRTVIK